MTLRTMRWSWSPSSSASFVYSACSDQLSSDHIKSRTSEPLAKTRALVWPSCGAPQDSLLPGLRGTHGVVATVAATVCCSLEPNPLGQQQQAAQTGDNSLCAGEETEGASSREETEKDSPKQRYRVGKPKKRTQSETAEGTEVEKRRQMGPAQRAGTAGASQGGDAHVSLAHTSASPSWGGRLP